MLVSNFSPFPELTTDRLLLRCVRISDATAAFHLRSNREVMRFVNRPLASTIQDAEEWIGIVLSRLECNDGITWCICQKENPDLHVGNIALWRIEKENYRAEVGYMLEPSLQGKGIMYEALQKIIQYGFHELHLHSIEAQIDPANLASSRLLEKSGFVREAYFKENIFWNGRFGDTAVYSLLAP